MSGRPWLFEPAVKDFLALPDAIAHQDCVLP